MLLAESCRFIVAKRNATITLLRIGFILKSHMQQQHAVNKHACFLCFFKGNMQTPNNQLQPISTEEDIWRSEKKKKSTHLGGLYNELKRVLDKASSAAFYLRSVEKKNPQ